MMTEFQQRVVDEKAALDEKIKKLNAFFATEIYAGLTQKDQQLLSSQFNHMTQYSDVLAQRIQLFNAGN